MNILTSFILSVSAGAAACCICKWLDGEESAAAMQGLADFSSLAGWAERNYAPALVKTQQFDDIFLKEMKLSAILIPDSQQA